VTVIVQQSTWDRNPWRTSCACDCAPTNPCNVSSLLPLTAFKTYWVPKAIRRELVISTEQRTALLCSAAAQTIQFLDYTSHHPDRSCTWNLRCGGTISRVFRSSRCSRRAQNSSWDPSTVIRPDTSADDTRHARTVTSCSPPTRQRHCLRIDTTKRRRKRNGGTLKQQSPIDTNHSIASSKQRFHIIEIMACQ
jgi:hypothetical protein